jgi:hypothetical protein
VHRQLRPKPSADLAERLQAILASKHLTLNEVSQQSGALYGRASPYFLPHNLYYELRAGAFTPSIYQLAVLSRISGYRLHDWLYAFGFDLEEIPRLQVLLPANRTVLLNSSLVDSQACIRWLENRTDNSSVSGIAPLSGLMRLTQPKRLASILNFGTRGFLYAKVGREDAYAFPDLVPGSIVRIDPIQDDSRFARSNGATSSQIFLIEHGRGLCCSRLRVAGDSLIVPVGTSLPYTQVELRLPREARILGVADLEIRPLIKPDQPEVPKDLAKHWRPKALIQEPRLGHLLRGARTKMNLSLRDASLMSQRIAELLGDERYFVSASSLSDYEVLDTPPRHFHKVITLCAIYGLQLQSLLDAIGIAAHEMGKEPMPDHLAGRRLRKDGSMGNETQIRTGFLEKLLEEVGEIPFFLRGAAKEISGIDVSLEDCFWLGKERNPLHPYLANALLVVVNRRKRKPVHFRSRPLWEQPLYLIVKRDRIYVCACCGVENGSLVIHPYSQQLYRPTQLRYHDEAEVVGQVVTIVRRLS